MVSSGQVKKVSDIPYLNLMQLCDHLVLLLSETSKEI
jgi:hypothetical protein